MPKAKVKMVKKPHKIRWGGHYLMVNRLRELEADIKVALTGDIRGVCAENPAAIRNEDMLLTVPSERQAGQGYVLDSDDEEEDARSDATSDADQVCGHHATLICRCAYYADVSSVFE